MAETKLQGTDLKIEAAQPQIGSAAGEALDGVVAKIDSISKKLVAISSLKASTTPDDIVTIGSATATIHDGTTIRVVHSDGTLSGYTGGTANFSTGAVTGGGATISLPTMTADFYIKALMELDLSDELVVTFGAEAATENAATTPSLNSLRVALGVLSLQDDGTGGSGNFLAVEQTMISVFPSIGVGASGAIIPAGSTSGSEKTVTIAAGVYYVNNNVRINFAGGSFNLDQAAFRPSGTNWNAVIVSIDDTGVLTGTAGTENAAKGSVTEPASPYKELPITMVYVQGDGAGSINNILVGDVRDDRPTYNRGIREDYVLGETLTGTIDGVNTSFTLANTPLVGSESLYLSGFRLLSGAGNDYTISGNAVTMLEPPETGALLTGDYLK